eukprot:TRINITY_DN65896_c10_g1_i1.p1 TRINITY_DN65896_c10_g1~~TRINITY_DN65896_c10_g1_i1.p1  ORF type:complete len:384 (+),score=215.42 TRINITY_DN65896_c10_g1_i1:38-1153(+)
MDVLLGKVIPLKHGFVGVVNRSQDAINKNKPIHKALMAEREFFQNHPVYRSIAGRLGTPYLARRLNVILMDHIKACLPEVKASIAAQIAETEEELFSYGSSIIDETTNLGALLLHLLQQFSSHFSNSLDGKSTEVSLSELYGGARISYIFHDVFARGLEEIDPFDYLTDQDIRTAIRNATGPRPALFVPEISFELLVRKQIERLLSPSLQCVDLVFDELQRVCSQCENHVAQLKRFPKLRSALANVVRSMLKDRVQPTKDMIQNLIQIELAYINTNHPDFIGGSKAVSTLMEEMAIRKQQLAHEQQQQQLLDMQLAHEQQQQQQQQQSSHSGRRKSIDSSPFGLTPQQSSSSSNRLVTRTRMNVSFRRFDC